MKAVSAFFLSAIAGLVLASENPFVAPSKELPIPSWATQRHIQAEAAWLESFCRKHVYDGPPEVEEGYFSTSERDCLWEHRYIFSGSGNELAVKYGKEKNGYFVRGASFRSEPANSDSVYVEGIFLARPIPTGMTLPEAIAAFRDKYGTRGLQACFVNSSSESCTDEWILRRSSNAQASEAYFMRYLIKQDGAYFVVDVGAVDYERGGSILRLEIIHRPDFEVEGRSRFMDGL